jgi:hypothetical protein
LYRLYTRFPLFSLFLQIIFLHIHYFYRTWYYRISRLSNLDVMGWVLKFFNLCRWYIDIVLRTTHTLLFGCLVFKLITWIFYFLKLNFFIFVWRYIFIIKAFTITRVLLVLQLTIIFKILLLRLIWLVRIKRWELWVRVLSFLSIFLSLYFKFWRCFQFV